MAKADQSMPQPKSITIGSVQDFIQNNEHLRSENLGELREKTKDQGSNQWNVNVFGESCEIGSTNALLFPMAGLLIHNEPHVISIDVSMDDPLLVLSNLKTNKSVLGGLLGLRNTIDTQEFKDLLLFISKETFVNDLSVGIDPSKKRIEIQIGDDIVRFCGDLVESLDETDTYQIEFDGQERQLTHHKLKNEITLKNS